MLAATIRVAGDIDTAEEAVQDAYASALATWGARGIPSNPGAWLTMTARRRAPGRPPARRHGPPSAAETRRPRAAAGRRARRTGESIPDDRLALVFTCCHPALAVEARVALTLRLVCGLSTADVARAFLVPEGTMAARITRAKQKITTAGIPYRVPVAR